MDIEQMRRINALSKEFQKHRFATSAQDGFKLAEATLGNQRMQTSTGLAFEEAPSPFGQHVSHAPQMQQQVQAPQMSPLQMQFQSTLVPQAPEARVQQQAPAPQAPAFHEEDNYLLNKKIELLVQKSSTHLETQLEALREMVTALNTELDHVKKALARKEEPRTIVMTQEAPREVQKTVAEEPKKEAAYHPKQGNVTVSDVSIEKMFYFGNKR